MNFIEVLQGGRFVSDGWYRLLNLGYRINPAAGSDWPYSDFPGVVRNYVKLDGPLNLDAWFDVVPTGPHLRHQRTVARVHRQRPAAWARSCASSGARSSRSSPSTQLNPDVDKLDRLELVVLGDVDATPSRRDGKDSVASRKRSRPSTACGSPCAATAASRIRAT